MTGRGIVVPGGAEEAQAGLTHQILAFLRRQTLRPEVLGLSDLMRETEPMLRRTLGEDVEVKMELEPGLREVEVDRTQMMQVIVNLAVNARDAMPSGGKLSLRACMGRLDPVSASALEEGATDTYVVLSVSDTGDGMTDEVKSRIFEPFFTTKPEGEGTGLGLSTVYGIVAQSGGQIRVESQPGKGTSFFLYFPPAEGSSDGARS